MADYEHHTDDHRLKRFSVLTGWKLEHSHQDIRGLPLFTAAGAEVGKIDDLLVDEAGERVAAVRLEDGRMIPVEPLEIQDDRVIDHGVGHAHATEARTFEAKTVRPL